MRQIHLTEGTSLEQRVAGEQLEQRHTQGPNVCPPIYVACALHLFGRHVEGGPRELVGHCFCSVGVPSAAIEREIEVESLDADARRALGRKKLRRLGVSMHDAERVRLGHCVTRLNQEIDGLVGREWCVTCHLQKVTALQAFRDDEERAVFEHATIKETNGVLSHGPCCKRCPPNEPSEVLLAADGRI